MQKRIPAEKLDDALNTRLYSPRQTLAAHPRNIEQYRQFQMRNLRALGIPPEKHQGAAPRAYVNMGRWVFDCECNAGVATGPLWNVGFCAECGRQYDSVEFPRFWRAIEAILESRRPANRNWIGETVGDLLLENIRQR